jgi:hypothetical protein
MATGDNRTRDIVKSGTADKVMRRILAQLGWVLCLEAPFGLYKMPLTLQRSFLTLRKASSEDISSAP